MYSVSKRIEFCYGHRLLDYDGVCKHPHGHNAVAEIEIRTGQLDSRNMVCDFSDMYFATGDPVPLQSSSTPLRLNGQ